MVDRALRFDLLGRDKTLSRTLGQAEGKLHQFGRTTLKLGALIGGAFAGIQVAGFLKGAIDEARDAAKVGRQTNAVLKATGSVAKVSARDVARLADALAAKVGVDDEVIASGANMLLTFKGVRNEVGKGNDIFNQASATILDMTAALHQGQVSQEGLEKTTILVGKALNDPIRGLTALTRVGVTFDAGQRKQITSLVKAGKTMEAQKIILGELKTEFGGAAAAAADPWQRFGVVMGNIKERIGTVLLPALTTMATFLSDKLPAAIDFLVTGPLGRFVRQLGRTKDILGVLGPKAALKSLFPSDLAPTIDKIATAVGKVATGLIDAGKRWAGSIIDGITTGLKTGNYGPLGKALGDAIFATLKATGDLAGKIKAWFASVDWVNVGKAVGRTAFPFAVGFVTTLADGVIDAVRSHPWDTVFAVLSVIPAGRAAGILAKVLGKLPILGPLLKVLEGAGKLVEKPVLAVVGAIGKAFGEGFARIFPGVAGSLRRLLIGIDTELRGRILYFVARGKDLILGLVRGIGSLFGLVIRTVARVIDHLTAPFRNAAAWLVARGQQVILGLGRGLVSMLGSVTRWVGEAIRRVIAPFGGALSWLYNAGRNVLSGLAAGIRAGLKGIGAVLSAIKNAIVGGLMRLFHMSSPSKVMAGIGQNIIGGLVRGIVTSTRGLREVIRASGRSALDWITAAFGGIGGAIGGLGSNMGRTGVEALMQRMAAGRGWRGAQWAALRQLVMHESGFNPNAQNPTSTAYGLFQFLDSTWASVGATKTSSPVGQIVAGFKYIASRYGNPVGAWNFWQGHHWYGEGGIFTRPSIIGVGERGPEAVVPLGRFGGGGLTAAEIAEAIVEALRREPPVVRSAELVRGLNAYQRSLGQRPVFG